MHNHWYWAAYDSDSMHMNLYHVMTPIMPIRKRFMQCGVDIWANVCIYIKISEMLQNVVPCVNYMGTMHNICSNEALHVTVQPVIWRVQKLKLKLKET